MKVNIKNDLLIIYINKIFQKNIDTNDKEQLEQTLKEIFIKINNRYQITFNGYYNINIYIDKNYGSIIEIKKEELEYLDYFTNQIEMNIKVIEDSFLYEIDEIDTYINKKFDIYLFYDKIYIKLKKEISPINMIKLLEHTQIIYGKEAKKITEKSKKIGWLKWKNQ